MSVAEDMKKITVDVRNQQLQDTKKSEQYQEILNRIKERANKGESVYAVKITPLIKACLSSFENALIDDGFDISHIYMIIY
jgi:hypothetical protein